MTVENTNWFDDLFEEVDAQILSIAKFKTHKLRKQFLGDLKTLIQNAILKNTTPRASETLRKQATEITHPNPNKSIGFAIMTEGMSQRGDEQLGVGPSAKPQTTDPYIQKIREHNSGVRHY